jgi:uncharacterized protein (DUF427 family)
VKRLARLLIFGLAAAARAAAALAAGRFARPTEELGMKATLNGTVIAESADTVAVKGYDYFPILEARMEWLEKSPRTPKDFQCPHGVQFYDVVVEGKRYTRNAWIYERPRPEMAAVTDRVGFWEDVTVG